MQKDGANRSRHTENMEKKNGSLDYFLDNCFTPEDSFIYHQSFIKEKKVNRKVLLLCNTLWCILCASKSKLPGKGLTWRLRGKKDHRKKTK